MPDGASGDDVVHAAGILASGRSTQPARCHEMRDVIDTQNGDRIRCRSTSVREGPPILSHHRRNILVSALAAVLLAGVTALPSTIGAGAAPAPAKTSAAARVARANEIE